METSKILDVVDRHVDAQNALGSDGLISAHSDGPGHNNHSGDSDHENS